MTSFFRLIWVIPILIVQAALSASSSETVTRVSGNVVMTTTRTGGGIESPAGACFATLLMIVFRQRYPRWWFDFAREYTLFGARVGAYIFLLTDQYPSTVDEQSVHLDIDNPAVKQDLNRWLPLVKWFLAIPHCIVLIVLGLGGVLAWVIARFAICSPGATRARC